MNIILIHLGNKKVPYLIDVIYHLIYFNNYNIHLLVNKKIFNTILYAFPVQVTKSNATLKDLISIFGDSNINVDLKFHPLYETYEIEGLSELPKNFSIIGFDTALEVQPESAIIGLRLFFSGLPILGTVIAMLIMRNYDISEERANEIKAQLKIKRAERA